MKRKKKTLLSKGSLAKTASLSLAKTAAVAAGIAIAARMTELLTPSIQRLFSPEKAKTPALGSPIKSLIKELRPKKALVLRKATVHQNPKA